MAWSKSKTVSDLVERPVDEFGPAAFFWAGIPVNKPEFDNGGPDEPIAGLAIYII